MENTELLKKLTERVERERAFQLKRAGDYNEAACRIERARALHLKMAGNYNTAAREELIYARYDQAVKILDWVLKVISDTTNEEAGRD